MIYNIIPQYSLSSGPVIVPFPITIPRDELTSPLILEVFDREASTIVSNTLSLTEMPQFPTISLVVDLKFPHAGRYELVKRQGEIADSEQQWGFVVHDVDN